MLVTRRYVWVIRRTGCSLACIVRRKYMVAKGLEEVKCVHNAK